MGVKSNSSMKELLYNVKNILYNASRIITIYKLSHWPRSNMHLVIDEPELMVMIQKPG